MKVIPAYCPLFFETLKKHSNLNAETQEFILHKINQPLMPYGKNDYPFRHGNLKGYNHAKLEGRDVSIVYTLSGSDPKSLKLYGLFSHSELGTGTPPNMNKQKSIAKRLSHQQFNSNS